MTLSKRHDSLTGSGDLLKIQGENERLRRDNERLRDELNRSRQKLAESEERFEETRRKIADSQKQIADLERPPVVNSDETGYRTNGEKRWLWALVARNFVFYTIAASRGAEVLVRLLGEI